MMLRHFTVFVYHSQYRAFIKKKKKITADETEIANATVLRHFTQLWQLKIRFKFFAYKPKITLSLPSDKQK